MLSSIFGCSCGGTATSKKVPLEKLKAPSTAIKDAHMALLTANVKEDTNSGKKALPPAAVINASAAETTSSTTSALSSSAASASTSVSRLLHPEKSGREISDDDSKVELYIMLGKTSDVGDKLFITQQGDNYTITLEKNGRQDKRLPIRKGNAHYKDVMTIYDAAKTSP